MASISAVEIDGTDSSYLQDDSLVVDCDGSSLDGGDSLVVDCDDSSLNDEDSAIGSENITADSNSTQETLSFDDLKSKINGTPAGSTLDLYDDFTNLGGHVLMINKDLTIDGHGHTLDAHQHGCFKSTKGHILIKNLIIKNACIDSGAIFIAQDAWYIIDNCSFINNHALKKRGGAICNIGYNSLTILNSIFDSNYANCYGGAVYSQTELSLINSTFNSNKADIEGGAILGKNKVIIDHCNFSKNYAGRSGGAVFADKVAIEKTPSHFEKNVAYDSKGGAIYANYFSSDVYYASFIYNSAGLGTISDDGGAVYIKNENRITFASCIFVGNRCTDEGGAIYLDSYNSHLSLRNNIFMNNSAGDEGQTVFNCGYYDTIRDNYWAGKNPSSNNDQLVEWKATIFQKNKHHSDSNPLKIVFELDKSQASVNETVTESIYFCNSNGTKCSGKFYGFEYIYLPVNENLKEISKNISDSSIAIEYQPQIAAYYALFAYLFNQSLSLQKLRVE